MDLFVIMKLIRLALVILKKGAYCSWYWTRMEKVVTNISSSFAPRKTIFVPKKDLLIEMEKEQDNPLLGIQLDKRGSK
jgi:hypothetical protein